ncbi:serine acetyltransferase [Aphanothece hegewaldii CCALA 016]|uniref:Serine acetyltransferase n=1 Tax=Aphanothece hegewaldii CCALA 016 TaxID=2107694 RepID=A0A2T1M153_9CHRO|nr:serine O-acetyltransferase [Aphanothece hegewaldii]PSF38406.1 serine acetyltransferase [Aphanothece hegewaldii CCALA 016]
MKQGFRSILFILQILWVSPLLIPFWLTTEKKLILADVSKWVEYLDHKKTDDLIQLLTLLKEAKEYRNLYYFRLFHGNLAGRIAMYILKLIYREFPYLFLDKSCTIGPGLFIQHGFSTIIMADLGENCWINQQVTIGYKDKSGRPKIGNQVRITAGAKVLGNIKIGDNVTVGANAVVVKDVPDNCVVVGIPAYIIKRDGVKVKEKL